MARVVTRVSPLSATHCSRMPPELRTTVGAMLRPKALSRHRKSIPTSTSTFRSRLTTGATSTIPVLSPGSRCRCWWQPRRLRGSGRSGGYCGRCSLMHKRQLCWGRCKRRTRPKRTGVHHRATPMSCRALPTWQKRDAGASLAAFPRGSVGTITGEAAGGFAGVKDPPVSLREPSPLFPQGGQTASSPYLKAVPPSL
jgi:hypothetical protein